MILKQIRKKQGLTQHKVAEIIGVSKDYISMIERGKRTPSSKIILKLSQIYSIPAEQIFLIINRTICSDSKTDSQSM